MLFRVVAVGSSAVQLGQSEISVVQKRRRIYCREDKVNVSLVFGRWLTLQCFMSFSLNKESLVISKAYVAPGFEVEVGLFLM